MKASKVIEKIEVPLDSLVVCELCEHWSHSSDDDSIGSCKIKEKMTIWSETCERSSLADNATERERQDNQR